MDTTVLILIKKQFKFSFGRNHQPQSLQSSNMNYSLLLSLKRESPKLPSLNKSFQTERLPIKSQPTASLQSAVSASKKPRRVRLPLLVGLVRPASSDKDELVQRTPPQPESIVNSFRSLPSFLQHKNRLIASPSNSRFRPREAIGVFDALRN